jgi:hypothetical protein
MNISLINEITRNLGIFRELCEDEATHQWRVKYSVIGLQLLASLYDKNDDIPSGEDAEDTVSHQYVTGRAKKLASIFAVSETDAERILELYKETGFVLTKRNRLTYPNTTLSCVGDVCLARGIHPSDAIGVSGLCMLVKPNKVAEISSVQEMFSLSEIDIIQWFKKFEKSITNWKSLTNEDDVNYLNINESANKGYWNGSQPKRGQQTLCRTSDMLNYWLVKSTLDGIKCSLLPSWATREGEYYRIAIALRVLANNSPLLRIKKHQSTFNVAYDYLLPPAEQNFVEVCSWRKNETDAEYTQRLHRVFEISLYTVITELFSRMGYTIEEE